MTHICILCTIVYIYTFHEMSIPYSCYPRYFTENSIDVYVSKSLGTSEQFTYETRKLIDQSIYLSICVSVYFSTYGILIYLSSYRPVFKPICTSLSTCLSTCPPTCLSRCLDTCQSICLCQTSLSIWPFYLYICLSIWTLPVAGNSYVVVCPSPSSLSLLLHWPLKNWNVWNWNR